MAISTFAILMLLLIFQFVFDSSTRSVGKKEHAVFYFNFSWHLFKISIVLVLCMSAIFCISPRLTAYTLKLLGQGGGVDVWMYTGDQTNGDNAIFRDFEIALSDENIAIHASLKKDHPEIEMELLNVPRQHPLILPSSGGVPWKVFGKMLLLTNKHAYVKLSEIRIVLNSHNNELVNYNPHTVYRLSREKINLTDVVLLREDVSK